MANSRLVRLGLLALLVTAGCGDGARPATRPTAVAPLSVAVASVKLQRVDAIGTTTGVLLHTGAAFEQVAALLPSTFPPTTANPPAPCQGCQRSTLLVATADGAVRAWVFTDDDEPASLRPAVTVLAPLLR